ncbi:hypothetical protein BKA62DRAFT_196710 [Auriculariales sp. MPI-PUGE-AT-0066]|nr:hypothetical protein BKA62DRAFT_196710 [Auriculariales sp. MPI-PUGE-AT-0066]
MRASVALRRAHKPLIHFLGKRPIPSHPHEPSPHPAAPSDVTRSFSDFLKRISTSHSTPSSSSSSSTSTTSSSKSSGAINWWDAPARLVRTSIPITELEADALLSGGASLGR